MSFGFQFTTGSQVLSDIFDTDRPGWYYMGSFIYTYNTVSTVSYTISNPNGYSTFSLSQNSNGDGIVWGVGGRPPTPAPAIETLWSSTSTPSFSISGSNVVVTMGLCPTIGYSGGPGAKDGTWTCKLYGKR